MVRHFDTTSTRPGLFSSDPVAHSLQLPSDPARYTHHTMPRARPQLSITLPRNFTFHYTEGDEPKTPEQESEPPPVPKSPRAYRIKRRSRPTVATRTFAAQDATQDIPIPSIKTTMPPESTRPSFQQRVTEPAYGFLAPIPRHFLTAPRTPTVKKTLLPETWTSSKESNIGDSISRPMSACSLLSDSSDESDISLQSYQSKGGSCTSPESDAADPFGTRSIRKPKSILRPRIEASLFVPQKKQSLVQWTPEMDRHLWTTYLVYLQDPTVTPFKLLPGVAPPLGVCHRVARAARRTWKGTKASCKSPEISSPLDPVRDLKSAATNGSPDTITAKRSGSNTPTGLTFPKAPSWPKSGSSTRRRLRELCKRKPTIAPHYQRLLQSRSPSPFSSSSPRSNSRSSRPCSPFACRKSSSAFDTRDIQLSLTTSTAATMQPDGPLAQFAQPAAAAPNPDSEWFNEPPVPWASPTAIPSDLGQGYEEIVGAGQLGSPFNGFHTWGPSRSRQHLRPTTPRTQSSDVTPIGPTLRSPVRLHDTFPYPSMTKRRAQHQLEDELSPGGTDIRREMLENLFGAPAEGRHRRRNRGFSLGDMSNEARLAGLFTPPSVDEQMTSPDLPVGSAHSATLLNPPTADSIGRLGSPFAGIGRRPSRRPLRHMATASLSAYDPSTFSSIEQRLSQDDNNDLSRLLRSQPNPTPEVASQDSSMQ